MKVTFKEKYLQDLYEKGEADKKHRFQPNIVRKYGDIVNLMKRERDVLGLFKYKSLNYKKLVGDRAGLSSVRVNDQYRIEFEEYTEENQTVATICNIAKLSNHYR